MARQRAAEAENRLHFTLHSADIGTWDLDPVNQHVNWDERCKELFGYNRNELIFYHDVLKYIHTEDVENVEESVAKALDPSLEVYADMQRFDQVLINLVTNAVKYAPDSNRINLSMEQIKGFIKVSVQDFGIGIPPEKLKYIFSRYYRVDLSGNQFSGLGLGLYISAEIVRRHGGEINVESELGKGSSFWFTIPAEA